MSDFQHHGDNPGASRFGNFINYYEFHPPENRMVQFPKDLWHFKKGEDFVCLDIGCNTGSLTQEVFKCLSTNLKREAEENATEKCYFLGVDIDPVLIVRADENNSYPESIQYKNLDFMDQSKDEELHLFLKNHHKNLFDVIFCFSITMWIHLNHGDNGLKQFLKDVCDRGEMIVIEAQPWKCYRSAVRRLKRSDEKFPLFGELKMRLNIEKDIEDILIKEFNMVKVFETSHSSWGRRLVFFSKPVEKTCSNAN